MSSRAIQKALDAFEIDGGITYLDNEPLQHVRSFPLYSEGYVFACRSGHSLADRTTVTWAEAVAQPLCVLSDDMQNRRILDDIAADAGVQIRPRIETNSFLGVASHLRNGKWCAIVPHTFGIVFDGANDLVLRPLVEPARQQTIGLVLTDRDPQSPMVAALQDCAAKLQLDGQFTSPIAVG